MPEMSAFSAMVTTPPRFGVSPAPATVALEPVVPVVAGDAPARGPPPEAPPDAVDAAGTVVADPPDGDGAELEPHAARSAPTALDAIPIAAARRTNLRREIRAARETIRSDSVSLCMCFLPSIAKIRTYTPHAANRFAPAPSVSPST